MTLMTVYLQIFYAVYLVQCLVLWDSYALIAVLYVRLYCLALWRVCLTQAQCRLLVLMVLTL